MLRLVVAAFTSAVLAGCASTPESSDMAPTPSTVRFLDARADIDGTPAMKAQAIEGGVRLYLAGILAMDGDVAFLFGSLGAPAGDLGSVLMRTGDGGSSWSEVMRPVSGSVVQDVKFADDGRGWALVRWTVEGPGEVILYRTTDAGRTWEKLSDVPKSRWNGYPSGMSFSDASNGQVDMIYEGGPRSADRVAFLTTHDGGLTWKETRSVPLDVYHQEHSRDAHQSAGRDGSLWKLESGDGNASQAVVSRRPTKESGWSVVSVIPRDFKYVNGRLASP